MQMREEFPIASATVGITKDAAIVDHIVITDLPTRDYLAGFEDSARVGAAVNCLQVGARALAFAHDRSNVVTLTDTLAMSTDATRTVLETLAQTATATMTASTQALPQHVNALLNKLQIDLQSRLDPENTSSIIGKLRKALIADYREVSSNMRKDLDLSNDASPLSALRTIIENKDAAVQQKLAEILQQGAAKAATASERSRGTAKGMDLEDALESFLGNECRPRKDLVLRTGAQAGLDGNLVGDFVIEVDAGEAHGSGLRIVIEAKNAQRGRDALVRELDRAIKNRGAAFGITVVNDPKGVGPMIVPVGDDKLIVRVVPDLRGRFTPPITVRAG